MSVCNETASDASPHGGVREWLDLLMPALGGLPG